MKIYLVMMCTNFGETTYPEWAFKTREEAVAYADKFNQETEEKDRKDAAMAGKDYEEWVGSCQSYAYVQQVELL